MRLFFRKSEGGVVREMVKYEFPKKWIAKVADSDELFGGPFSSALFVSHIKFKTNSEKSNSNVRKFLATDCPDFRD